MRSHCTKGQPNQPAASPDAWKSIHMGEDCRTQRTPPSRSWSNDLMTEWISIEVVADHGVVRINLPDGACTDMTGVIRMAKALMPHVWRIETWSGDRQDTVYLRSEDGE